VTDRPTCTDYSFPSNVAETLRGAVLLPVDIRRELLTMMLERHGAGAIVEWFAQFIGLANSVVANNREAIEIFGIVGGDHPHTAEKYNLPTIAGALNGVVLAAKVKQKGLCHGCAYRLGSIANQSPITTDDAEYCTHDSDARVHGFWCHEHMDGAKPTKLCGGHKQRMRGSTKERA
jgi:hypothetical protein